MRIANARASASEHLMEHFADDAEAGWGRKAGERTHWQTAAEVQRASGGETHEIAKALDRLWKAGYLDRDAQEINIGAGRKGGGASCFSFDTVVASKIAPR